MLFQDNVLREYLKNVYFIAGTPCGGKTTVSRELGRKYNIPVYDIDEMFEEHQRMADELNQPNMKKQFANADEFFGRSAEEYSSWLTGNTREQLDFVVLDLITLAQDGPIICDCHLTLEQARMITSPSRVAYLLREPVDIVEEYCNRRDHQGFRDFIYSASDVDKAKATCEESLHLLNADFYVEAKNSEFFWLEKDINRSVEDTVALVAAHFGLKQKAGVQEKSGDNNWQVGIKEQETGKKEQQAVIYPMQKRIINFRIEKVDKDSFLRDKLLDFVKSCSWKEAKEHIAEMIENWMFTDWETMFVAIADKKIVGMVSAMKTDYYPDVQIGPWISSIFVSEDYRGHRISEELIDYANIYLMKQGFKCSYIPSEHRGLYEKYGYSYVTEIINYDLGVDYLFCKLFQ